MLKSWGSALFEFGGKVFGFLDKREENKKVEIAKKEEELDRTAKDFAESIIFLFELRRDRIKYIIPKDIYDQEFAKYDAEFDRLKAGFFKNN